MMEIQVLDCDIHIAPDGFEIYATIRSKDIINWTYDQYDIITFKSSLNDQAMIAYAYVTPIESHGEKQKIRINGNRLFIVPDEIAEQTKLMLTGGKNETIRSK